MRIANWNVNSLRIRLPQVLDWLSSRQPDILALQETKIEDAHFPQEAIQAAGFHVVFSGQKTYNGVALISRQPITDCTTDLPSLEDDQRRLIAATIGQVRVVNLYVPNGSEVGSDKYFYKLEWLDRAIEYVRGQLENHPYLAVLGDFNIAPEDRDVYNPEGWREKILCSTLEREAFRRFLASGLEDAFRLFEQPEGSYSWWDYRAAGFRRNHGLRIDHILVSKPLSRSCILSEIDKTPRRLERPSDHAPVLAEFKID